MAETDTDAMTAEAGGVSEEPSWAEQTVAAMQEAGLMDDDDAEEKPEAEAPKESEKPDEPEKPDDGKADPYAQFGRQIAEGMERDPVGTLKRLQEIAAQANPQAMTASGAETEDEDTLKGEEPLTEFERALWPHADALRKAPERLDALQSQVGSVVDTSDVIAVTVRAMWDVAQALLPDGVKLPQLDTQAILREARGGGDFEGIYAKAWREPLKAAMTVAKQTAVARPGAPASRTGSKATTASGFAELYLSDDVDNDVAAARARRRETLRPLPPLRPKA